MPRTDGGARVGAVLLAAGRSSRFDAGNKLVAEIDGTPVVRHAAETLRDAVVADVVVVVGHESDAVREALAGLGLSIRENPDYTSGKSSSVRAGVVAARDRGWEATVFALGDMPFLDPGSVDALVKQYGTGTESVVAAAHNGQRGNPVLFDAQHYDALAAVTGDSGGRRLLQERGDVALVDTGDPGVIRDIDALADLPERTETSEQ